MNGFSKLALMFSLGVMLWSSCATAHDNPLETALDLKTGTQDKYDDFRDVGGLLKYSDFHGMTVSEITKFVYIPGGGIQSINLVVSSITLPAFDLRKTLGTLCGIQDSAWTVYRGEAQQGSAAGISCDALYSKYDQLSWTVEVITKSAVSAPNSNVASEASNPANRSNVSQPVNNPLEAAFDFKTGSAKEIRELGEAGGVRTYHNYHGLQIVSVEGVEGNSSGGVKMVTFKVLQSTVPSLELRNVAGAFCGINNAEWSVRLGYAETGEGHGPSCDVMYLTNDARSWLVMFSQSTRVSPPAAVTKPSPSVAPATVTPPTLPPLPPLPARIPTDVVPHGTVGQNNLDCSNKSAANPANASDAIMAQSRQIACALGGVAQPAKAPANPDLHDKVGEAG